MKKNLINRLVEIGVIQTGDFTLKSGKKSPLYIDMRLIMGYPDVFEIVSRTYADTINDTDKILLAVPYGGIGLTAAISLHKKMPWLFARKETKNYGAKKMIEGVYKEEDEVIIIEDVITTGKSVFETIDKLEKEGLKVHSIVNMVDRRQGGVEKLQDEGYNVDSVISIYDIVNRMDNSYAEKAELVEYFKL